MTAPNGIGAELGTGLGAFAQGFVGTQNTIQQQRLAAQQQADQLALQQRQAAQQASYQTASLAQNQQQLDQQAARDQATLTAAAGTKRATDFKTYVEPAYNAEYQALDTAIKTYGPTAGANFNPARYSHAQTRMKQLISLMKDVSLGSASGEGYDSAKAALLNFIGAPDDTGTVPANPATAHPGAAAATPTTPVSAPPPDAPVMVDYSFPPAAAPAVPAAPVAHGDAVANGDPGPVSPPAAQPPPQAVPSATSPAPGSTSTAALDLSQYARIQDVPMSALQNVPDSALVARFGEGSDLWAQDAWGAYVADQKKARLAAITAQNALWKTVIGNLTSDKDHPATATQLAAAGIITLYGGALEGGQQLTSGQMDEYNKAVHDLAPLAYTPATWQQILNTKDPAVIAGSYDIYKVVAPDVVQGFNVQPFVDARDAASQAAGDAHAQAQAALRKTNADAGAVEQTTNFKNLLNGATSIGDLITAKDSTTLRQVATNPDALKQLGITDGGKALLAQADLIDQSNKAILTNTQLAGQQTQQAITTSNFDLGVKKLGELATVNASPLALSKADPHGWYVLKQQLGLNDASLSAIIGQAQYKYGLGLRGDQLANDLTSSKILTDSATRAGVTLDNQGKQQTIGLQAVLGGSKSLADVIQAKDSATLRQIANDHSAKVLLRISDGGANLLSMAQQFDDERAAQTNQANASAFSSTATGNATNAMSPVNVSRGLSDIDKIRADIKDQARRTDGYLQSVKGTLDLDAGRLALMGEQTLAYRLKNPSDPLYNKDYANQTAGSFYGDLAKEAGLYTGQANSALKAANAFQKQIDSIKASVKQPFGGAPDLSKLPADQQKKLSDLITQRDHALLVMSHRNASAEQVISDGLGQHPATPASSSGTTTSGTGNGRALVAPAGFRAQTDSVAQRVGVNPQHLYAFLGAESSFGTNTSNYKGMDYVGAGQIGQAAQDDVNKAYHLNLDRNDPAQNLELTARYYKMLAGKYGGDPMKVYAAYNMGAGNLDAYLKNNGGKINMNTLPAETRTGIGNLIASMRGYVQDKPSTTTQNPTPKATLTASAPPAPAAQKPALTATTPSASGNWGPAAAALPAGMKVVGSVTQYAQELRQRGWFGAVAALKAGDGDGLHRLIQQATQRLLPTGTADQRLALQRDLWDTVNN